MNSYQADKLANSGLGPEAGERPRVKRYRWMAILAVVAAFAVVPLGAATIPKTDTGAVEITPFIGYRFGGDLDHVEGANQVEVAEGTSYGIMLDFEVEPDAFVEIRYSLQSTQLTATGSPFGAGKVDVTDLDLEHYMVGGTYQWETPTAARPFVSADLGAVRFDPQGFDSETRFGFAIGGGVKLPMGKHAGLRFDGRWVSSRLSGNTDLFCTSAGACLVVSEGTFFNQFEFTGGISFRF